MTYIENIQRIKNEALNKIVAIHTGKFVYCEFSSDGSYTEQRDSATRLVIEQMNREIDAVRAFAKSKVNKKERENQRFSEKTIPVDKMS